MILTETVKSLQNPQKTYKIKWNSDSQMVFIFYSLKDGRELNMQVGKNAKSIEDAKLVSELYLKDNEDRFIATEINYKNKGLL